ESFLNAFAGRRGLFFANFCEQRLELWGGAVQATALLKQFQRSRIVLVVERLACSVHQVVDPTQAFRFGAGRLEQGLESSAAGQQRGMRLQKPERLTSLVTLQELFRSAECSLQLFLEVEGGPAGLVDDHAQFFIRSLLLDRFQ